MKTGRRGVEPTKKGEDPKKPKAQSEVKVTAKKQYNWEDVAKNEEVKARNKAASEKYQSDTEAYNRAMKLYREGDVPTASKEELSILGGSTVKGKKATFSGNKDIMSAARDNEMYEKGLKSGEYVDIDDPRIDPKTRYFLKGATMKVASGKDILGERSGKVSVPYEMALGKSKPTKWADVYGGKDFDPYEFEKASRSGKLDEYKSKKGINSGEMFVSEVRSRSKYKTPVQPQEPYYEKEENIGLEKVIPNKIPLLKAKIDQPKGKLIGGPVEKGDWEGPAGGVRTKSRYVKPLENVKTGEYIGQNIKYAAQKAVGKQPILRPGVKKTREALIQGKTGREEQMAKAYFGAGYGNQPLSTINESKAELQGKKKELKARIRANEGDVMTQQGRKAELKDVKAGIKQAKLAGKYLEKYDRTYQGANQGSGKGGKIGTFTGEALTGFNASKQNTYDPNANRNALRQKQMDAIKRSTDNAANKNTITNQEKSLSFKEKVQASKQNRQNAPSFSERRKQRIADTKLQKSIKIPGQ